MAKRADVIRKLHDKGLTYEEIGQILGITRQAAHQAAMGRNYFHETTIHKVKYMGLRKWMLENAISIAELERRCGVSKLYASLVDHCEPRKYSIDAILKVTGLTYEECFKEDKV